MINLPAEFNRNPWHATATSLFRHHIVVAPPKVSGAWGLDRHQARKESVGGQCPRPSLPVCHLHPCTDCFWALQLRLAKTVSKSGTQHPDPKLFFWSSRLDSPSQKIFLFFPHIPGFLNPTHIRTAFPFFITRLSFFLLRICISGSSKDRRKHAP